MKRQTAHESLIRELEREIGGDALLSQALVHSSYLNEHPGQALESNERLEFLGDSVLSLVLSRELFQSRPNSQEGQLTAMRAWLASRKTLAQVARRLRLGERLLMSAGEERAGGRSRESNLADALEAVVAAIYLKNGVDAARSFVLKAMAQELQQVLAQGVPKDPKSRLQEIVQARGMKPPSYRVLQDRGEHHPFRYRVEVMVEGGSMGTGEGRRKSDAQQVAAAEAIRLYLSNRSKL